MHPRVHIFLQIHVIYSVPNTKLLNHTKDQWWVLWLRRIGGKMLACHIIVPLQVLATQLQIKLLADVPGKVADNGPGVWLTATCVRNPCGVPSSSSQPHTIPAVAGWDVKCFTFQI